MNFTKTFSTNHGRPTKNYLKISNGIFKIRLCCKNKSAKRVGLIEGGIGIELVDNVKKTKLVQVVQSFNKDDIPVNLQASGYTFEIPATMLSDNEYVFYFKEAKMS